MAYVSILVAASVSFVIIGSRLGAITTFPSFKVAFGGLPIKITGYLFGPLIGAVTGLISDIVSFALLPTYYHPLYSFIMAMSGFVPGVIMWAMVKKERKNHTHFLVTFIMLCAIGISTIVTFQFLPEKFIVGSSRTPSKLPIHNRSLLQTIASSGFFLWAVVLIVLRFVKKLNKYIKLFAPIILFCSILEVHNSLMTPLADSLTLKIPFGAAYVMHMFTSPIKIISNVLIIAATYKIVGPLVKNKMDNSYEGKITNQKIYVCGPTVYNEPHIGNLRPIITFDIFVRSLKSQGQKIEFIHNITDIDDKIIDKAISENKGEKWIAKKYTKIYMDLLKVNNIRTVTSFPTVTKSMRSIIHFIEDLIKEGFAYESEGNVFFEVNKDKKYNSISNRKFKDMKFKEDGHKKKHPADFAIWKKTTKGVTFKSPWGKGRPGWHTECATFINKHQGVDVHGGGIDLLFPHHQNEASQFRVLNNKEITNEWKHVGPINLDGSKMSKSIGNVLDARNFIKRNGNKLLRMLFLTSSVSSEINITDKLLSSLNEKISKFMKASKQAQLFAEIDIKNNTIDHKIIEWDFSSAMKELNSNLKDFNSSTKDMEAHKQTSKVLLGNLKLLGLLEKKDLITRSDIKTYRKWEVQKENKNYVKADVLRDRLINSNII